MSRAQRAIRDAGRMFGSRIAVAAFSVVWSAWLVRRLPEEELAVWPICLALGDLVVFAGTLGTRGTFARLVPAEIAQGRPEGARWILRRGLLSTIAVSALLAVVLWVMAEPAGRLLFKDPVGPGLVRWMVPAVFLRALRKRLESGLSALQEFGTIALVDTLSETLRSPLSVVLYLIFGIEGVIAALTLVPLLASVLFAIRLIPHLVGPARLEDKGEYMRVGLSFYGGSILGFLAERLDYLLLAALTTPAQLAPYFVARKLAQYVEHLNTATFSVVRPKLAEHRGRPTEDVERVFTKGTRYFLLFLVPVYVAVAAMAPDLIGLYAGDKYESAVPLLRILCLAMLAAGVFYVHRDSIGAFARPSHMLGLEAVGAAVGPSSVLLLVRPLGALGVALARTLTYAIWSVAAQQLLRRTLRIRYDMRALKTALWASTCMAAVILVCHTVWPSAYSLLVAIPLGIATYGLALHGRLAREDVELVLRCLPQRFLRRGAGQKLSSGLLRFWAAEAPGP